jgi:hypothetical protein
VFPEGGNFIPYRSSLSVSRRGLKLDHADEKAKAHIRSIHSIWKINFPIRVRLLSVQQHDTNEKAKRAKLISIAMSSSLGIRRRRSGCWGVVAQGSCARGLVSPLSAARSIPTILSGKSALAK